MFNANLISLNQRFIWTIRLSTFIVVRPISTDSGNIAKALHYLFQSNDKCVSYQ